jgi:hypothetical protein
MNESNEKLLNDYLTGASRLSRVYRSGEADEPSAHLDAAIKAAAHRAVSARPALVRPSGLRAWFVPLSAAAVVVLASLLVLRVGQSPQGQPDTDVIARAPMHPPSVATAPVAEPAAPPQQTSTVASAEAMRDSPAASSAEVAPSAPTAEQAKTATGQVSEERQTARAKDKRTSASAPPVAAVGERNTDAPERSALQRGAASESSLPEKSATANAPTHRQGGAGGSAAEPASAGPSQHEEASEAAPADESRAAGAALSDETARADTAAQQRLSQIVAREGERKGGDNAAEQVAGANRAQPAAAAAAPAASAVPAHKREDTEQADAALQSDPEKWVGAIVELQRQGKTKQMEAALRAFKQRYPQHALPRDLNKAWDALQASDSARPQ